MSNIIYSNSLIKVEIHLSQIPWLIIFTKESIKEFSMCDKKTKNMILKALTIIEIEMLKYFNCTKINIASFGNYVPHVHFHIMARFKNDDYFPEPMWGDKQRNNQLTLKPFRKFHKKIAKKLRAL